MRVKGLTALTLAALPHAVIGTADDEGEEWNPPPKGSKAAAIFGKPGTGKGMLGWLPSISEKERKQAVLVDSESDAEYDDDNEQVRAAAAARPWGVGYCEAVRAAHKPDKSGVRGVA